MQGSHSKKKGNEHVVSSHVESRTLLGIVATYHVNIEGHSVRLVPVPYNPRGYTPKVPGGGNKGFNARATACFSVFPGFKSPTYGFEGLPEMGPFFDALATRRPKNERKMHRLLYNILPNIFREMLSQRELYTRVTNYVEKRAFFFHIHQIHYSLLVQRHNSHLNPNSRAKPNTRAENWAGLEVDVLVKVVEAVILARETYLQDLSAKRNAEASTQAGSHSQDQQGTDLDCFSMRMKTHNDVEVEARSSPQAVQEPGMTGIDEVDFGFMPELEGGNDGGFWLNNLGSEDEASVPRPPPTGREHRQARQIAQILTGEMRTRNAVDRWIRFVRLELSCSENAATETPDQDW